MTKYSGLSPRRRGNLVRGTSKRTCSTRVYPRAGGGTRMVEKTMKVQSGTVYPRAGGGTSKLHRYAALRWTRVYPRAGGGTPGNGHDLAMPRRRVYPRAGGGTHPPTVAGVPVVRRVYPRAGGGTRPMSPMAKLRQGLSPRSRGNPWQRRLARARCGSIPAQAGEPPPPSLGLRGSLSGSIPAQVGGSTSKDAETAAREGLSPRRRGNLDHWRACALLLGSIPAQAGEPRS